LRTCVVALDTGLHYPHSFPTRRSSDLEIGSISKTFTATLGGYGLATGVFSASDLATRWAPELAGSSFDKITMLDLGTYTPGGLRSEEHTSELQSRENLVCRLLLEKKK